MPPRSFDNHDDFVAMYSHHEEEDSLVERAAYELEGMKRETADGNELHPLPPACYEVIKSITGNDECVDCGASHPDWATVSYGALICMRCCARHRSLGVQFSKVRSLTMDHWSYKQVLKMMEGGNQQLGDFFSRHALSADGANGDSNLRKRYLTKAAKFYQQGIDRHICQVVSDGLYRGREVYRKIRQSTSTSKQQQQLQQQQQQQQMWGMQENWPLLLPSEELDNNDPKKTMRENE
mmetsp:Transcript_25802/g.43872  ORF Transcript_25802/g.43872 Transcript_25802/m.43872 type:complete len:237 (+) Transcript_25802:164-874(+)